MQMAARQAKYKIKVEPTPVFLFLLAFTTSLATVFCAIIFLKTVLEFSRSWDHLPANLWHYLPWMTRVWKDMIYSSLINSLLGSVLYYWLARLLRVDRIDKTGIVHGYRFGSSESVPWADVRGVDLVQLGNLRFARIAGKSARPYFLPLFLEDELSFAAVAGRYCPKLLAAAQSERLV